MVWLAGVNEAECLMAYDAEKDSVLTGRKGRGCTSMKDDKASVKAESKICKVGEPMLNNFILPS